MNDQELLQKQIEAYLTGELNEDDQFAFEKALEEDKELEETVALVKDVETALGNLALEEEIAPIFKNLGQKYIPTEEDEKNEKEKNQPKSLETSKNNQKIIKTVFVFVIGAIMAFLLWNTLYKPPVEKETPIFATYYEPYTSDKIKRGGEASVVDYQQAVDFYKAKEYEKAIPILKEQLATQPNDAAIQLLLGNCYLSTNPVQLPAAISIFEILAKNNTHLFTEISQWYLALAYIENEQKELAQPILQALAAKKIGKYSKLAEKVLSEINN